MPCYQVENNIPVTAPAVFACENLYPPEVTLEYVFVDDGSSDDTFNALRKVQMENPQREIQVIKLSRNFGANNASLAGYTHGTGDWFISLAADLQDPPEWIPKLYEHTKKGYKLVLANREKREDTINITFFAAIYHWTMRKIMPQNVPPGGFDLFLFSREVKEKLLGLEEKNAYIPYLLMWLGYEYVSIPYTRRKREIGQSMWTLPKKIKAFIDSVVAFSYFPIRMISVAGLGLGFAGLLWLVWILVQRALGNSSAVEGWTSLMIVLLLVSSFQMIALGVIGEYVWRALDAARGRPNFIVDKIFANPRASG